MKNKNLLTKAGLSSKNIDLYKSLYVGTSVLLLVGGCDFLDKMREERPAQVVEGGRRTPVLNRQLYTPYSPEGKTEEYSSHNSVRPESAIDGYLSNSVKPSDSEPAENNPYDRYDDKGNIVEKPSSTDGNDGDFFKDLFGFSKDSQKKPVIKVDSVAPTRKALPGNPYVPESYKPVTPNTANDDVINETSATSVKTVEPSPAKKMFTTVAAQSEIPEEPAIETAEKTGNTDKTLLEKISSYLGFDSDEDENQGEGSDNAISEHNNNEAITPQLSSVPEKPQEFENVKGGILYNLEDLRSSQTSAAEEKADLDLEVSGELPAKLEPKKEDITKERNAKEDVFDKPVTQTEQITSNSYDKTQSSVVALPEEPTSSESRINELPKQDTTPSEPKIGDKISFDDVAKALEEKPESKPDSFEGLPEPVFSNEGNNESTENKVEMESEETEKSDVTTDDNRPSFFERIFGLGDNKNKSETSPSDTVLQEEVDNNIDKFEENSPSTNAPANDKEEKSEIMPEPLLREHLPTLPKSSESMAMEKDSLIPATQYLDLNQDASKKTNNVAEKNTTIQNTIVNFGQKADAEKAGESEEIQEEMAELPSPDIIKTMRPSRYELLRKHGSENNSGY